MTQTYRIISARFEFDTQHIALVGNDSPICGSKIMQANEIPLKLGYLCERCARKYTRLTKLEPDSLKSAVLIQPDVEQHITE
jgi:DNA-directed RNA polymerase subunit RPC12/RpoP